MTCVDTKFNQGLGQVEKCLRVYGVCVNFMSTGYMYDVSRIRPTHWRLNDDFDINRRRRGLSRNIRIGVCVQARSQVFS